MYITPIIIIVAAVLYFLFNKVARDLRILQKIFNEDPKGYYMFVSLMADWEVSQHPNGGVRIMLKDYDERIYLLYKGEEKHGKEFTELIQRLQELG